MMKKVSDEGFFFLLSEMSIWDTKRLWAEMMLRHELGHFLRAMDLT